MPHGVDESEDAYLCSAYRVRDWNGIEPIYIRSFNISSSNKLLHHMVIHACGHLNKQPGDVWYVYYSSTINKMQTLLHRLCTEMEIRIVGDILYLGLVSLRQHAHMVEKHCTSGTWMSQWLKFRMMLALRLETSIHL